VSSIEPNDGCGKVDSAEEVSSGLVITRCNRPELLQLGEEVLDQVASLIGVAIEVAREFPVRLVRNDGPLSGCCQGSKNPLISIESLVGQERRRLHAWKERIGPDQVMSLPPGQVKPHGIAQRIDQGMDLGA
jgi:hypothetical protein